MVIFAKFVTFDHIIEYVHRSIQLVFTTLLAIVSILALIIFLSLIVSACLLFLRFSLRTILHTVTLDVGRRARRHSLFAPRGGHRALVRGECSRRRRRTTLRPRERTKSPSRAPHSVLIHTLDERCKAYPHPSTPWTMSSPSR